MYVCGCDAGVQRHTHWLSAFLLSCIPQQRTTLEGNKRAAVITLVSCSQPNTMLFLNCELRTRKCPFKHGKYTWHPPAWPQKARVLGWELGLKASRTGEAPPPSPQTTARAHCSPRQEEHSSPFSATQLIAEGNSDSERQRHPGLALSYPRSEPKLKQNKTNKNLAGCGVFLGLWLEDTEFQAKPGHRARPCLKQTTNDSGDKLLAV